MNPTGKAEFVECHYNGKVFFITPKVLTRALLDLEIDEKKYMRYKTGAHIYDLSERTFNQMAHDADAVYKYYNCAIVKRDEVEAYSEMLKPERG